MKSELCLRALRNLLKKIRFAHYYQELLTGQIDQVHFQREVEDNPDKYSIHIELVSDDEAEDLVKEVMEICQALGIGDDMNVSDINEMFGYDLTKHFMKETKEAQTNGPEEKPEVPGPNSSPRKIRRRNCG